MSVTLKQLKPIFKTYCKNKQHSILNSVNVLSNSITVTDLESTLEIKDNYNLNLGLHNIATIDLINNSVDASEYPLNNYDNTSDFKTLINVKELANYLHFVSKDETRLHLNALAWTSNGLVATDGYKLHYNTFKGSTTEESYLLPSNSVKKIVALCKKYKFENIEINFNDTYAFIDNSQFLFTSRLIQRDYPKWTAIVPSKTQHKIIIDKWINFKELKPLMDKKHYGCKIFSENNVIFLELKGSIERFEIGQGELKDPIGFNAQYLDIALKDQEINEIHFNDYLKPVLIPKRNGYNSIVMPLKL